MLLNFSAPASKSFSTKLSTQAANLAKHYPFAIALFAGVIDLERFNSALAKTFNLMDFLFCQLTVIENNIYAKYIGGESKYSISLEVDSVAANLAVASDNQLSLMPQSIDRRVQQIDNTVEGLPMIYLRLTQLSDGFALAYYFNHCLLDQSSLVYFLKTLCHFYNNTPEQIEAPRLIDPVTIVPSSELFSYADIEEFRHDATRLLNKTYCPDPSKLRLSLTYFEKLVPCQLVFKKKDLKRFKANSNQPFSTNDIINAILMKINAHDLALQDYQSGELGFAHNGRKHLGLTDAAIGNIFGEILVNQIERAQLRELSLLNLAVQIRAIVSEHRHADFSKALNWLHNLEHNQENYNLYIAKFLLDPCSIISSNWSSFDYSSVKFDESVMLALLRPLAVQYPYAAIISFNNLVDEQLMVNVTLPESALEYAQSLSESSELYRIVC